MHYLLNIGNTRVAAMPAAELRESQIKYYATENFLAQWSPRGAWSATVACVVPAVRRQLEARWPGCCHFITSADFPELDFRSYGKGLGADRMANAAAGYRLASNHAVMVVDCGTALNTVAVDRRGKFCGGVILPGRQTALNSLGRQTAQLPEITVRQELTALNPLPLTTEEAIRNGVDFALLSGVEHIIRATRRKPGFGRCMVVLTGGDAPFYGRHLPPSLNVTIVAKSLTLDGIRLAASKKHPDSNP